MTTSENDPDEHGQRRALHSAHGAIHPIESPTAKPEQDLRHIRRKAGRAGVAIWLVELSWRQLRASRSFNESKFGSADLALQAAQAWRDATLTQLKQLAPPEGVARPGGRAQLRAPVPAIHPSLVAMHASSQAAGVTCLDSTWFGIHHSYSFRCAHGHEWQRTRVYQRVSPRCPACGTAAGWAKSQPKLVQKLTDGLQRLQERAQAKGGRCLSGQYLGSNEFHRFECAKGHVWETAARGVVRGTWCRACFIDTQRLTLQDAQQAAQARGGQCLSAEYVNDATPMLWECDRGHTWWARLNDLRSRNTWCPECAHFAQITNRNSKARRRYVDGGKHLLGETPPEE